MAKEDEATDESTFRTERFSWKEGDIEILEEGAPEPPPEKTE